jgi:hypothetical protein
MAPAAIILIGMGAMVLLVVGGLDVLEEASRRHGGVRTHLPEARLHVGRGRGRGFAAGTRFEGRNRVALWSARVAGLVVITVGIGVAVLATGVAILASIVAGMS